MARDFVVRRLKVNVHILIGVGEDAMVLVRPEAHVSCLSVLQ
jgi:hypothetical protein